MFGGRAAYIHVGAIIGTIMVANVSLVIIPGQRRMLAQIRAGQEPDPRPGQLGKTRSVHNTYFTLPVLFIMISNHYPMTYGGRYGWLVLRAISAAGVLVRRFFVLSHKGRYVVGLPIAAALLLARRRVRDRRRAAAATRDAAGAAAPAPAYADVAPIVAKRCAVCHAARPRSPASRAAPAGVLLDTPRACARTRARIDAQAVRRTRCRWATSPT